MALDADSTVVQLLFCPRCGARLTGSACSVHGVPRTTSGREETATIPRDPFAVSGPLADGAATARGALRAPAESRPTELVTTDRPPWASTSHASASHSPARRSRLFVPAGTAIVFVALVAALVSMGQARQLREDLDTATGRLDRLAPLADRAKASEGGINGLSRRVSSLEAARDATPDTAEVAARVQRSVFTVETDDGEGSGWVVSSGHIVTNFHVVSQGWVNDRRDVTLRQDDKSWPATVVDVSPDDDLAVIEVDAPFTALERASGKAKVGDPVLVVGSPLGLGGTVSSGIVSAYRSEEGLEYLQFSAPVSPGNSGGPVVDGAGRVIGISVAKYIGDGAEGLSFAIPIERACAALSLC